MSNYVEQQILDLELDQASQAARVEMFSKRPTVTLAVTPLLANGVYTQPWQDAQTLGVNYVGGSVYSDQSGTLYVDMADDQGQPILGVVSVTVTGGQASRLPYTPQIQTRYFRFRYVNGTTAQTVLEVYQEQFADLAPREVDLTTGGSRVSGGNPLPVNVQGSQYKDLGQILTGANMAAGATIYSAVQTGLNWVRNVVVLAQSDQQYEVGLSRIDSSGLADWGSSIISAQSATNSSWRGGGYACVPGTSAKFYIKNSAGVANTFANARIQLLGQ